MQGNGSLLYLTVFALCVFAALAAGVLSAYSDYKGLMIPNRYSLIVILSFLIGFAALYAGGQRDVFFEPLFAHLLAGGAVFLLTFIMFAVGVWGAGDSKLLLAYALWTGFAGLKTLIIVMAVFGGTLGVFALFVKKYKPFARPPEGQWIDRVQSGENVVPYGVAIAAGAFAAFYDAGYIGGITRIFG